jgi:long-chain acyl-CoA synthetase
MSDTSTTDSTPPKPWLASYPAGVPEFIETDTYQSVCEIFDESAKRFAERPAFKNFGKTLTYGEIEQQVAAFAAWCRHEAGLNKGDRIAVMMPNLLQYPIVVFGALRAGLVVVNTNPLYTERELEHQLSDSGATAIVVAEAFAHTVQGVIARTSLKTVVVTAFGDMLGFPKSLLVNLVVRHVKKLVPAWDLPGSHSLRDVLSKGASLPATASQPGHDDIAFLQYTGGTTGVAKGAMLTHGNMTANVLQAHAWIISELEEGKEVIVTALPLYHIFALTANCLTFMRLGALNLLITNPRDLPAFVKDLSTTPFSVMTGVNTLFNALLARDDFKALDFSSLKVTLGGGMAVQEAVANRWKEVTGVTLIEAYGLTETSPAACMNPMNLGAFNHSIGLPISSTEASVRDPDNQAVPNGETGELCIRGPQVMSGYWQRPDATAETIDAEGWLHTGDIATLSDTGFVQIVDRLKDMILVSGFNVYPNEIEGVIASMPEVLEVGAIGVPDDHSGEVVKVVIVKQDPSLTEDQVHAHCKENLTGYKRPKLIQFVDEIPKTNVGKILRRELREL